MLTSLTSVSDISLASEGACGACGACCSCGCGCCICVDGPVLASVGVFVVMVGAESVWGELWAPVWGKDMAKTGMFSVEAVSMCFLDYEYVLCCAYGYVECACDCACDCNRDCDCGGGGGCVCDVRACFYNMNWR